MVTSRSQGYVTFLLLMVVLTLAGSPLLGAETGSVSGVVRDEAGALPGVRVTIKGSLLPAGRSMVTDTEGDFAFKSLLPGTYTVRAELPGLGAVDAPAVVAVDRDTQVRLVLRPSKSTEVEVTATSLPLVDAKATEVATNTARQEFEQLPLSRSYSGLFQLTPGVPDNARISPNAGGNRQDNLYLFDGANVTNPFFGDLYPSFAELDIQEVNIKRGAVTADFGRTGGFVVNAVTKSGTNDFKGQARAELQPASFSADYSNGALGSSTDTLNPGIGLGGPVFKDYAWFYASANFGRATTKDRTNLFNVRPGTDDPATPIPDTKSNFDEYFGKLTATPSPAFFLTASYRYRDAERTNGDICSTCSAAVANNTTVKNTILDAGATWYTSANAYLEVKYNQVREDNTGYAVTQLGYRPAFDPTRPDLMGQFRTTSNLLVGGTRVAGQTVGAGILANNKSDFFRDEVRASFSLFLRAFGAEHELKTGVSYDKNGETLDRVANGWGTVTYTTSDATCGIGNTGLKGPCFTASYTSRQPQQDSLGSTWGIYVQDRITIANRFNILLGLLANRDEWIARVPTTGADITLLSFSFGDMLQPRLGVTYQTSSHVNDKVYVNYARYYNADNKSLARAASPYRIYSTSSRFDMAGNLVYDVPAASETGKVILPGIKPMYTDEFVAGYARPFGGQWAAEIWGQYRTVGDVLEDYPTKGVDTANPTAYVYGNLVNAYRKYRALTIEVNKAYSDHWAMSFSYTYSRLEGNWDLDQFGDSRFYASSSLQDGPGFYVEDPNRDGILTGDRTHVFKLFASYEILPNLSAGTYVRVQSGQPYEARGYGAYAGNNLYIEPAGSRKTPTWTNVDLQLSYGFPIAKIVTIRVEGRVLNVFNSQPALTVDNRYRLSDQSVNPAFEVPTSYATPRRFILSAIVDF